MTVSRELRNLTNGGSPKSPRTAKPKSTSQIPLCSSGHLKRFATHCPMKTATMIRDKYSENV